MRRGGSASEAAATKETAAFNHASTRYRKWYVARSPTGRIFDGSEGRDDFGIAFFSSFTANYGDNHAPNTPH